MPQGKEIQFRACPEARVYETAVGRVEEPEAVRAQERADVLAVRLHGDSNAWIRLFKAHQPCIRRLSRLLVQGEEPWRQDLRTSLVDTGRDALLSCCTGMGREDPRSRTLWEPARDNRLWTFAFWRVYGDMIQELSEQFGLCEKARKAYGAVMRAYHSQLAALGREPRPAELVGLVQERVTSEVIDEAVVRAVLNAWQPAAGEHELLALADVPDGDDYERVLAQIAATETIAALVKALEAGAVFADPGERQRYLVVLHLRETERFEWNAIVAGLFDPAFPLPGRAEIWLDYPEVPLPRRRGTMIDHWPHVVAKRRLAGLVPPTWPAVVALFKGEPPRLTPGNLERSANTMLRWLGKCNSACARLLGDRE